MDAAELRREVSAYVQRNVQALSRKAYRQEPAWVGAFFAGLDGTFSFPSGGTLTFHAANKDDRGRILYT